MKYERFNLRSNPFLEEAPDFAHIDRADVERKLKSLFQDAVEADASQILVVLGEYGIGKTFTLQNIRDRIQKGEFLDSSFHDVRAVYFKVTPPRLPTGYTHYVYSRIIEGVGREALKTFIRDLRDRSPEGEIGVQRQLSHLGADFRNALSRLDGRLEGIAWAYLRGKRMKVSDLRKLKAESSISGDTNAEEAFMNLLRLLRLAGQRALLLFIDEIEYIFSVTSGKKVAQVMNTFKDLYDKTDEAARGGEPLTKPHFVFASTPSAWNDLMPGILSAEKPATQALWERVFRKVTLRPFRVPEARKLIGDRLRKRQIEPSKDLLAPFSGELMPLIVQLSQGVPRRIIRICAYTLIEAIERDADVIDDTIIQHVYEYYPWARLPEEAKALV